MSQREREYPDVPSFCHAPPPPAPWYWAGIPLQQAGSQAGGEPVGLTTAGCAALSQEDMASEAEMPHLERKHCPTDDDVQIDSKSVLLCLKNLQ